MTAASREARSSANSLPFVEPADRQGWHDWLERNGAESRGVWLAVGKKGGSRTRLTYEEAVEEALVFGWIDSTVRRLDEDRFKQLFTPRKPTSTWSRSNKERVARLIAEDRMTPAGLAAIEVARSNGSWELLDEIESMAVPDDLAAALAADPKAAEGFSALAESARKAALYWIATAKRPQTRADRIAGTIAAAREGRAPR